VLGLKLGEVRSDSSKLIAFFDSSIPRHMFFSVNRRLKMIGYRGVWAPASPVGGAASLDEAAEYCSKRGIPVIVTMRRRAMGLRELHGVKVIYLDKRARRSTNKVIARIFEVLRHES